MDTLEKKKDCSPNFLIFSGMLLLIFGSLGRYTYSTVMPEIIADRGFTKAEAGIVTACLFFCYAIAQVVFTKIYRKFPVRLLCFVAWTSAAINFAMPFCSVYLMATLWAINGVVTSVTYMMTVELFAVYLPKEKLALSSVFVGLGTSATKLVLYGFASVGSKLLDWRWTFWVSAIVVAVTAAYWFWFVGRYDKKSIRTGTQVTLGTPAKEKKTASFWVVFCLSILAALAYGFTYHSIENWFPVILREEFGVDQSVIYLLMIAAIAVALFSNFLANPCTLLSRNFPLLEAGGFLLIAFLAGALAIFVNEGRLALFLILCFGILVPAYVICTLNANFMAIRCRNYIGAGAYFAVMNASSSGGICICDYGVGNTLDHAPWQTVFWIIFAIAVVVALGMLISAKFFKNLKE